MLTFSKDAKRTLRQALSFLHVWSGARSALLQARQDDERKMAHRIDAFRGGAKPLKMERQSDGKTTIIWLIGRIRAEHLAELEKQVRDCSEARVLDLSEVTIVDADVIRFLISSEREGTRLAGCPAYVREWILRERAKERI